MRTRHAMLLGAAVLVGAVALGAWWAADGSETPGTAADERPVTEAATGEEPLESAGEADLPRDEVASRCERAGYPCLWQDVGDDAFARMVALHEELQGLVDAAEDAEAATRALRAHLEGTDDLAEWAVDETGHAGAMFRIDGSRPAIVWTDAALGLAGEPADLDVDAASSWEPPEELGGPAAEEVSGAGEDPNGTMQLARYRPAGGPLASRRALVLDVTADEACSTLSQGLQIGCRKTRDGTSEGQLVASIMEAHPEISVNYLTGSDVDPASLAIASEYDLVHIVTHGARICGEGVAEVFPNTSADAGECVAAMHLGKQPPDRAQVTVDILKQEGFDDMPEGVYYDGEGWSVTTDFFEQVGGFADTIMYLSACGSSTGRLEADSVGGFVGWDDYVRVDGALKAAAAFWRSMVQDGLEFDLAAKHVADEGLDSTTSISGASPVRAELVVGSPDNLRARDVIHDSMNPGARVAVSGVAGDGERDSIRRLLVFVEGVADGTEDAVELKLLVDGQEIDHDLSLAGDGQVYHSGEGFNHWKLTATDVELPFDVPSQDPDDPEPYAWEARAYEDSARDTATRSNPVHFLPSVRAEGRVPHFDRLASRMPATSVTGNKIVLEIPQAGGEVIGQFEVQVRGAAAGETLFGGDWLFDLAGQYDSDADVITGTGVGQITRVDGTVEPYELDLEGHVDHRAGTVTGRLGLEGQAVDFEAEF